jgi:hypothetical protein
MDKETNPIEKIILACAIGTCYVGYRSAKAEEIQLIAGCPKCMG